MRHIKTLVAFLLILALWSCASTKNTDSFPVKRESPVFYNHTWQLEYISGSSVPIDSLFPNDIPELKFDDIDKTVRGHSGCNGYSAMFTKEGTNISFSEPAPSTLKYCGEGEPKFLSIMTKIDHYSLDEDGKLNLIIDEIPILRFHKK